MAGVASALVEVRGRTSHLRGELSKARQSLFDLANPLKRIRDIAGGILLADIFRRAAAALRNFASASLEATGRMQALRLQMQSLVAREMAQTINAGKEVGDAWVTASSIFDEAGTKANQLFLEIRKIGVLSPYSIEAAANVFRLGMAFSWSTEQAMAMTKGILNLGAGIGASTEQLERMTFNFAQIRMQGKIMARDFWELGKAGFDLMSVLRMLSRETGYVIEDHKDFNKLLAEGKVTWDDFVNAFVKMTEEDFGGAAARFAVTLEGIKNNMKDVFQLIIPAILMPTAELFGEFAQKALDGLLQLVESGDLERWGLQLREFFEGLIDSIKIFFEAIRNAPGGNILAGIVDALYRLSLIDPNTYLWLKGIALSLGDLWEKIKYYAGVAWNFIIGGIEGFIEGFMGATTLQDADIAGILDLINDKLGDLGDWIGDHADNFRDWMFDVGEAARPLAEALGDLAVALAEIVAMSFENAIWFFQVLFEGADPDAVRSIENTTSAIEGLTQWLRDNKEWFSIIIPVIAGFWAAWQVAGVIAGVIETVWWVLEGLFVTISGIVTSPIVIFLAGLATSFGLLVFAAIEFSDTLEQIRFLIFYGLNEAAKAAEAIITGVALVLRKIPEWLGEVVQALLDWGIGVGDTIKKVVDDITNFFVELPARADRWFGEMSAKITYWLNTAANTISSKVTGWVSTLTNKIAAIPGIVSYWWGQAKQQVENWCNAIVNVVRNKFEEVKTWVRNKLEEAKNIIRDKYWSFYYAGRNIMYGLWDGLKSLWNSVKQWFTNLAYQMPYWLRSLLGIGSPSKVMAEIGESMVDGLIVGFDGGMGRLERTVVGGLGGMSTAFGSPVINPRNINVGGIVIHVTGTSDPEQTAEIVMEKLATSLRMEGIGHTRTPY